LDQAGLIPQDLDAILVSSTSPEMIFPSTACLLQDRMDIKGIPAFDLGASCTGFLYGLSMADSLIRAGQFRRCLVVASEIKSRSLDFHDLSTAILFGDGAGAAIVERSPDSDCGIMSIHLHADGNYHDLVKIPGGGSRLPLSQDILNSGGHTLRIRGSQLFRIAIQRLGQAVHNHLEYEKLVVSQLDQVVFHQANGRMLTQFCKTLGIPWERCLTMIEEVGNTSSASLPMALDRANRDHRLKSGDLLLLGAFGGGLTWGTALVRWG
jgi:3-oxoacyl-[acyl-carrier-protein] synthase III